MPAARGSAASRRRSLAHALIVLVLLALAWLLPRWLARGDATPPQPRDPVQHTPAGIIRGPLPASIAGEVQVLDADTWLVGGLRVRLDGVDAPEFAQDCGPQQQPWPCGREAIHALRRELAGKRVECALSGRDRYRRALGQCRADGEDVQAWLVREGWAVADDAYFAEEGQARQRRAGIWRDEGFTDPRDWRRERAQRE